MVTGQSTTFFRTKTTIGWIAMKLSADMHGLPRMNHN